MTTHYEATQGIIEAANSAMQEIAEAGGLRDEKVAAIRKIWEPCAEALLASIPDQFERDWPELSKLADDCGLDFVGVTSDTRRVVCWGADHGLWREFQVIG